MMKYHFDQQVIHPLPSGIVDKAYRALRQFVGARPNDRVICTPMGIEEAIFAAYVDITRKTGKNHFIADSLGEASSIMAMTRLQEMGCVFQMTPANEQGMITVEAVADTITPRTAMLCLSWANGLTGVVQPIQEIAELCHERGILLLVDATHVMGRGWYSFEECKADLHFFRGDVLPGPAGTGVLTMREGLDLQLQEPPLPLSLLKELAQAAEEAEKWSDHTCMEVARLRGRFEELCGGEVLFVDQERVPHISTMLFPGATSDALLFLLNQKGMSATFGGGHFQHLMHILRSCGVEEPACHTGVSFAFSRLTTEEEIEKGAKIVSDVYLQLRKYAEHLV